MFITFEGGEGVGKTEQLRRFSDYFTSQGVAPIVTREPGGCPEAESIRTVFLQHRFEPLSELFLIAAARREHTVRVLKPALHQGKTVLCDRFIDSTAVYQGLHGVDSTLIEQLNRTATDGLTPDVTFIYDLPYERARERLNGRAKNNRFDLELQPFHEAVRSAFLRLADVHHRRCHVIDADAEPDIVFARTLNILSPALLKTHQG